MTVTLTSAWQNLVRHSDGLRATSFSGMARDEQTLKKREIAVDGLRLIYAFQNLADETLPLLLDLARQQGVAEARIRMFAGEKINTTENRAVLHTALRRADDTPLLVDGTDVMPEIRATQKRIESFVDSVRSGAWQGATGKPIRAIVNIGIGGSDLGPRLAAQALKPFVTGVDLHYVANVDAFEMQDTLRNLAPEETLFVIVSKTFTTQETLMNARTARRWLVEKLGEGAVARHFVAVSVNRAEVEKFGIDAANMFPMWDWVGGRYSLWSAVGLSVALGIGNENFRALLNGAAVMDAHFQSAPLESNMPVILALLGIWNRNFLGTTAQAVLPYSERLRDLPRYLQQLEMESNGKRVTRDGWTVDYATVPALFGDCGSVGQHSFHQCLHQGTDTIPADFIGVAQDDTNEPDHHRALLSNLIAQMGALAFGQQTAAAPQNVYPGNRPSNLLLLQRLTPFNFGLLLALYEHKAFVQGIVWQLNSFDQPGVELGKRMAKGLEGTAAESADSGLISLFYKSILG